MKESKNILNLNKNKIILLMLIISIMLNINCIYKQNKITSAYANSIYMELEAINRIISVEIRNLEYRIKNGMTTEAKELEEYENKLEFNHNRIYEMFYRMETHFPTKKTITSRSDKLLSILNRVEKLDIKAVLECYEKLEKDIDILLTKKDGISNSKWLNEVLNFLGIS